MEDAVGDRHQAAELEVNVDEDYSRIEPAQDAFQDIGNALRSVHGGTVQLHDAGHISLQRDDLVERRHRQSGAVHDRRDTARRADLDPDHFERPRLELERGACRL